MSSINIQYDSEESRVRTMEVLQSRLSVLELLCEKTFPNITKLTIGIGVN